MNLELEDKYYTIKEVARMFSVTKHYIWMMVTLCKNCGKSYGTCKCGKYETEMQSVNFGGKNNIKHIPRIPHSEVEKRIKKYNPNMEEK